MVGGGDSEWAMMNFVVSFWEIGYDGAICKHFRK